MKKGGWAWQLAMQALVTSLLTALLSVAALALPSPAGAWLYAASMWGIIPLAAGYTAFRAVRRGLLSYGAWIMPPLCQCTVHWALLGYFPESAGMAGATALCCLVAAAAAQVLTEREQYAQRKKRGRDGGRKKHG